MSVKVKIIPLGGVTEIGKNMTAIEYGKDIIVVDFGSSFPSEEMLGIDLVIPDMTYLEKNVGRVRGFVITHGHEDHIGAAAYALKKVDVPVYGTRLTLALVENKLNEAGVSADLRCVKPGDTLKMGALQVEFIRVNHSIAGAVAVAITTPAGVVIHTGDFKIDYTPIDGEPIDLERFAYYGKKGVLCLLSDSTNAERPGSTLSERMVGITFEKYFDMAKGRVIVATFASSIHRIQQVIDTAISHGRKVCFQGRSMVNIAEVASELGYLKVEDKHLITVDKLSSCQDSEVCVLTTGSQGEPMSGLARMANSAHKLDVGKGDMVILSATPIPGNERLVSKVINQLFKKGVNVVYNAMADVHVSGHAQEEELKLMLLLTKPQYFIPVHGEYRHQVKHAMIAEKVGLPESNIFVLEIGNVMELSRDEAIVCKSVTSGSVMIDGLGIGDIGNVVLRDRRLLSQDGLFVVVTVIKKETGELLSAPDIISRGFVYAKESEELMEEARALAGKLSGEYANKPSGEWYGVKMSIKSELQNFLYARTKRNPMILPIIVEV